VVILVPVLGVGIWHLIKKFYFTQHTSKK